MSTLRTNQTSVDLLDRVDGLLYQNLTYTGTADATLVGNESANEIVGGRGNDVLEGGGHADSLFGGDGHDELWAFYRYEDSDLERDPELREVIQDQVRNGYIDRLYGGPGNDLYVFDFYVHENGTPLVIEYANEGTDTILGDILDFTLPDHVENYINDRIAQPQYTPSRVNVWGNALNNDIRSYDTDTDSYEAFYGLGGDDLLTGYGGDDLLIGGNGVDTAVFTGASTQYFISRFTGGFSVSDWRGFVIGSSSTRRGPDDTDTIQEIEVLRFSDREIVAYPSTPTYLLSRFTDSIDEGSTYLLRVVGFGVADGTRLTYTISGISAEDIDGTLTGTVTVESGGADIPIYAVADRLTEGNETISITVAGQLRQFVIQDTSIGIAQTPPTTTPPTTTAPIGGGSTSGVTGQPASPSSNTAANELFSTSLGGSARLPIKTDQVSISSPDRGTTWTVASPTLGNDTYTGFKRLQFDNASIALDFQRGDAGYKAAMMIGAAFGKATLQTYIAPGLHLFDSGMTMNAVAKIIVDLQLIEREVGAGNDAWVRHVYTNVVGSAPDSFSLSLYTAYLDRGVHTKTSLLELAASATTLESQINLAGLQTSGMVYTPFI